MADDGDDGGSDCPYLYCRTDSAAIFPVHLN